MSRPMIKAALAAAVLSGVLASPATAEERSCSGTLANRSLDNVRVPAGKTCTLTNSRLNGTVEVERNATLKMTGTRVNGNVQAEGARLVDVRTSRIGGAYQVKQGGAATLLSSTVKASVLTDSLSGAIRIRDNVADSDIQVFQNTGGASIQRNRVEGNLQCKANRPAPTGGGNVVQGDKEAQCARL